MPIWAIVPVKPFREAKSRLAPILSPEDRASLSRSFLGHTLETLRQMPDVTQALVISRDTGVLQYARKLGARTVTESGAPELNAALERATEIAVAAGADGVLVLPTDLPMAGPADLQLMIASLNGRPGVVIAPDRHGTGTNALLVRPPGAIPYAFGVGSFARHVALAAERGLTVEEKRSPALGLDVDLPEDLSLFRSQQLV